MRNVAFYMKALHTEIYCIAKGPPGFGVDLKSVSPILNIADRLGARHNLFLI